MNAAQGRERRQSKRRLLHGHVLLGIPGKRMIGGNMIDVSTSGIAAVIPTSLEPGQGCRVFFSFPLGADKIAVDCIGIVANCVCVTEGFRVGMRFIISDMRIQRALERFLTERPGTPVVSLELSEPPESTTSPVQLDPVAVVSFSNAAYPKTVRISELKPR